MEYLTPHQRRQQRAAERRITAVEALDRLRDLHPIDDRTPETRATHDRLARQLDSKETP